MILRPGWLLFCTRSSEQGRMYNTTQFALKRKCIIPFGSFLAPVIIHDRSERRIAQKLCCTGTFLGVVGEHLRHDRLHMLPLDRIRIGAESSNSFRKGTFGDWDSRLVVPRIVAPAVDVKTFPLFRQWA